MSCRSGSPPSSAKGACPTLSWTHPILLPPHCLFGLPGSICHIAHVAASPGLAEPPSDAGAREKVSSITPEPTAAELVTVSVVDALSRDVDKIRRSVARREAS